MIAGCPKCNARYRVDPGRISGDGAKLRCTKCSAVFLVRAPKASPAPNGPIVPNGPSAAKPAPTQAQPTVQAPPAPTPPVSPAPGGDSRLVLVADPDAERAKMVAGAIESWGLEPIVVHDGVEAMLTIARSTPRVVVLDAALPRMFGFQVCEVVKRTASLSQIGVILVGAIHEESRYRRNPSDLHGADVYLEQPDLPDGLHPLLREAGLPVSDLVERVAPPSPRPPEPVATPAAQAPVPPSPVEEPLRFESEIPTGPAPSEPPPPSAAAPMPTPPPTPTAAPVSEAVSPAQASVDGSAAVSPEHQEEIERAERLARIAVSEMVLYQPDKFDEAARTGQLTTMLDLEIQEAQALIRQRVSEPVRVQRDFILEELERVARTRGDVA